MRIAIFTDTYLPDKNGVATSIGSFVKLLADDGHQIAIFCPRPKNCNDEFQKNITIKRYSGFSTPTYKTIKLAVPSIFTVVKDLKEFEPDIIHIQTPMTLGWLGIWASNILKIKNIQTYHTYIPDFLFYVKPKTILGISQMANYVNNSRFVNSMAKVDVSSENFSSRRWQGYAARTIKVVSEKVAKNENSKTSERIGRDYTRLVYNRAEIILTPSNAMKKILQKQGVRPPVEVLSNGIDYDFFKKKTDFSIKNKIVHIGRLGFEKDVDVVIKAFALARKQNPKLKLDIYGDGPARDSLENLVSELGIEGGVKFFGFYNIAEVSQFLCDYDCFATASTIETQGIVILEAMAAGLPVLGVDVLAVPEIVLDDQNGYLSSERDINGMAKNMQRIVSDEKKLQQFGQMSLQIAKSHEIANCKDRLVGFYQRVIDSK